MNAVEMVNRCLERSQDPSPSTDLTNEEKLAIGWSRAPEAADRGPVTSVDPSMA